METDNRILFINSHYVILAVEMKFMRKEVLDGKLRFGMGANLGSSLTVEMISGAGFDWIWLDCEHGAGGMQSLPGQLQAASIHDTPVIVRLPGNDPLLFKYPLDLGASGVMVPYIETADEARLAVEAMRYPPLGRRGVAKFNRACGFGASFDSYFAQANDNLLCVVQIETPKAVANVDAIAAVDGADVLFVGPLDLSVTMGMTGQFTHPDFLSAARGVAIACKKHGKAAGTLVADLSQLQLWIDMGYTFLVVGTEGGCLAGGLGSVMKRCAETASAT